MLNIQDVAETQLCCGCGACAYISPEQIEMVDVLDHGRRPLVRAGADTSGEAMQACPGVELKHTFDPLASGLIRELTPGWGPVLELWEGYASDPEIRYAGSSGGAASALALYAIERCGMHGVLHTAAREDVPYLNRTVISQSREEILAATGSRYAPASPCDGLQMVEDAPGACVFIGKPCDVAGANKAAVLRPKLAEKLGLTIGIFCAGTPSTAGTLEMIRRMGVDDPANVASVRYRGNGWPGKAVVTTQEGRRSDLTYEQSWGEILTKHVQWRCRLCVDHTGEFADIAVGDPWHKPPKDGDLGKSLVLVRTQRGRAILQGAVAAGYLDLTRADATVLPASQRNLLGVRGSVWGRLWTCWLCGAAVPRFDRMSLFRFWWSILTWREKLRSVGGTVKRIFRRKLKSRVSLTPYRPPESRTEHHPEKTPLLSVNGAASHIE